jgi:NADH-quinone oxidoreductase subunit H
MTPLFGSPVLHALVMGVVLASAVLGVTSYFIWWERKFAGRMQGRIGPEHVGFKGLLQPIADAFKLLIKEDIIPRDADRPLFNLAPLLAVTVGLLSLAVVPLASGLVISDLDVGVVFFLAVGAMSVVPTWMAGWASNNKYALLGGMRAVAQSVAYGVPMVLAVLVPVLLAGSMSLTDIVSAQSGGRWFIWWPIGPGLLAGVLFILASLAEGNRIPFDIPEAESELVSGVSTEYSGMKFGMFYLAEYLHSLVGAAIFVTLFLGGYDGFGPHVLWLQATWFVVKAAVVSTGLLWVRWTFLRMRSDQLMSLCWKWLLPGGLVTVMAAAVWIHYFPRVGP